MGSVLSTAANFFGTTVLLVAGFWMALFAWVIWRDWKTSA